MAELTIYKLLYDEAAVYVDGRLHKRIDGYMVPATMADLINNKDIDSASIKHTEMSGRGIEDDEEEFIERMEE